MLSLSLKKFEFDESASWYSLPTQTPDSYPIPEDEASEPEEVLIEDEEFSTLEESPISFPLSRLNKQLSQNYQPMKNRRVAETVSYSPYTRNCCRVGVKPRMASPPLPRGLR